jgi:hypothetical protein
MNTETETQAPLIEYNMPPKKAGQIGALGLAPGYACCYAMLIPIAQANGYALAVHGSMSRDLDLIAVPWTEEAVDALTLVKALKEAIGGITHQIDMDHYYPTCDPKEKPHGRLAYSLHFTNRGCDGTYIDVSVMPRLPHNVAYEPTATSKSKPQS